MTLVQKVATKSYGRGATTITGGVGVSSISPSFGTTAGGTSVTITGTNFSGTPTVTIGGVSADNIVVVNGTTITCDTGAHAAGTVDVLVAGSGTGNQLYTYSAPSGDEPSDPGSGYLWSDNFDRYASAPAMMCDTSGGACGVGTDCFGLPDAAATYGQRTMPNADTSCNMNNDNMSLVTGRGGSGKALRCSIQTGEQATYAWLSPQGPQDWGSYSSSAYIVAQFWFRISTGGSCAPGGCKWFELWYEDSNSRMQVGTDNGVDWSVSNDGRSVAAVQPNGPDLTDVDDNDWHRFTVAAKRNTTGTAAGAGGPYSSSRDGFVRVWVDGTKIIDLSASGVGDGFCTIAEVDEIVPENYKRAQFPDVFNDVDAGGWTLDHDDFKVWVVS